MYTFARQFIAYLKDHEVAVTRNIDDDHDVLFVNSWATPYEVVRNIKERRPALRVVQRVDGSSQDYGGYRRGDRIQARVNLLADLTIFQSRYSRNATREKYHVIASDGPVIFNPVDLTLFKPNGPRLQFAPGRIRVACASWSLNPAKGTRLIDHLAAESPDIDFVLCGRFEGVAIRPNVIRLGHVRPHELAEALRSCDFFLNLSLKESAPNVVIEALASGLPVLYRQSGGVSELVEDCGVVLEGDDFRSGVEAVTRRREALATAARRRAETVFSPDIVFPAYLRAIAASARRPIPGSLERLRLWARGYPVVALRTASAPPPHKSLPRPRAGQQKPYRVGWATYDSSRPATRDFTDLDSFTAMRVGNVATWINQNVDGVVNELYRSGRAYDLVVLQKVMGRRWEREVSRLQAAGTIVVFDANVNYYEVWGDYDVPGTRPTGEQQRAAIWMTEHADWVVADSSYLAEVAGKWSSKVTWIPDNVDLATYRGCKNHAPTDRLRIVWSGVAKKAHHLRVIADVLAELRDVELVLVSDDERDLPRLSLDVPVRFVPFRPQRYAETLLDCDVIVSPKHLSNGYEMAHTEYKISLGMAVGLPAVAGPQPSYVEALSGGGGIIARTPDEWRDAFRKLQSSPRLRAELGVRARATIRERYSTEVVARQYVRLLESLLQPSEQRHLERSQLTCARS